MKPNDIDDFINDIDGLEEFLIELNDGVVADHTIHSSVEALSIAANVSVDDTEEEINKKLDLYLKKLPIGSLENLLDKAFEKFLDNIL